MKTTYLVWKNPSCNGVDPEWKELTGQEFYAFVNSSENKRRRFIKLEEANDSTDGAIVIEATEVAYIEWKHEKNHTDYLRNVAKGASITSYHAFENDDGIYGEELLPDTNCDLEAEFIRLYETELLQEALSQLNDDERQMVEYLYLSDNSGTVRGYEEMTGISKSTVNRRQQAVLVKLKKFFEN